MNSSSNKLNLRELLFKIIAISIPFLFLVLLEIVLRISHYGNDFSLFVNDPDRPGNVINNENISKRFFLNLHDAPKSYVQSFWREKPADTYRIFILGESSSLGFPYTHRGSFPRMLEFILHKAYPNKDFEVINLSITAINSFALLSFGDEIVKMAPDAILIYTGHNEYYGAMGAGSSNRLGYDRNLIRLAIGLRQFRVVQLAFNLADKFRKTHPDEEQKNDAGLMQKMAGEQEIAFGSEIYCRGLTQFEENMDELLWKFHKHNIPVFLSDIVSNEKDQKPFISKLSGATDSTAFMNEYHKGVELFNSAQFNEALSCFSKANNYDSTYAMSQFLTGEILLEKGDYLKARQCYINAKELDELRFRAPDAINGIVKKLSLKYSNIHFVNTSQEFIANSSHGILDNKLFIDHLHPNLSGNFVISKAFFETLTKTGVFGASAYRISPDSLKHEIPVTAVDSVYGALVALFMKEEWPFFEPARYDRDKPKSYPEKLAVMMFLKGLNGNRQWTPCSDSILTTGTPVKLLKWRKLLIMSIPASGIFWTDWVIYSLTKRILKKHCITIKKLLVTDINLKWPRKWLLFFCSWMSWKRQKNISTLFLESILTTTSAPG